MKGGITATNATRYKRRRFLSADMTLYNLATAEDNGQELSRLHRHLNSALSQEITPRQREMLRLYYCEGKTMKEIGEALGVNLSTVSRTIQRGERRLRHSLRYSAPGLLSSSEK